MTQWKFCKKSDTCRQLIGCVQTIKTAAAKVVVSRTFLIDTQQILRTIQKVYAVSVWHISFEISICICG